MLEIRDLHVKFHNRNREAVGGVKICGPMGFLSLLQEKLGLPNPAEHGSKRIATWENILKKHVPVEEQKGEPFYAASFRADSWNTAKRLLYYFLYL